MNTREIGMQAEERAVQVLLRAGYLIEERNVRTKHGEIDVVAWDGDTLCFVEVRYTASLDQDGPLATITWDKQRRIIRSAREYLMFAAREVAVRFDVLGLWHDAGEEHHLLLRGAFVSSN